MTHGDEEDSENKEKAREINPSFGKVRASRLALDLPTVSLVTTILPRSIIKWPPM